MGEVCRATDTRLGPIISTISSRSSATATAEIFEFERQRLDACL
jgi:hypothetical protein